MDVCDVSEAGIVTDVRTLRPPRPGRDWIIATLAERQYGVVSTRQLLAAGIGTGAIATRVRRMGLHRLHRGVYAVGHTALLPRAREMAAVLACGDDAVISHRSAAVMWRLVAEADGPVDVTVARSSRSRPGLRIHRSRTLERKDVRLLEGIPVTAPTRTLLDLAETSPERELERAIEEALVQRLTTEPALVAAVGEAKGRHGAATLKRLLNRAAGPTLTRSEAEERVLALVRQAELDHPELNVRVHGHVVDFLWRRQRLILEIDGFRFHSSRSAFERDRRRDAELGAAGYRVMRVTWRQIVDEPFAVIARLAQALAQAA
jgi:very-short-patch-repair endonuclease